MFQVIKKDITTMPFNLIYEDGSSGTDQRKAFAKYGLWLLPQALAYVSNNFKPIKNEDGRFDGVLTVKAGISGCSLGSEWAKGLIMYLLSAPRGTIFPDRVKATSGELLPYSALVPLFLAAYKKFHGIPYTYWDNVSKLIDKDLLAAMTCNAPQFNTDELLHFRVEGSTIKSGDKAGDVKNPLNVTGITKTGCKEFDDLPRLAKIMLTQVWVAHPTLRNEYMILDPNHWDSMPEPLISTEVLKKSPVFEDKMPWDD